MATTLPTVAPRPKCASAIRQTGPARIGSREVRNACSSALSSSSLAHEVRFALICFGMVFTSRLHGHSDNQIVRQIGSSDRPVCSSRESDPVARHERQRLKLACLPFHHSNVVQAVGP